MGGRSGREFAALLGLRRSRRLRSFRLANVDDHEKRIAEETAVKIRHAPRADDFAFEIARRDQLDGDGAFGAGRHGFGQRNGVAAHCFAADELKGETSPPSASADILHHPRFSKFLSRFEARSVGDSNIVNIHQIEARVGRRRRFGRERKFG